MTYPPLRNSQQCSAVLTAPAVVRQWLRVKQRHLTSGWSLIMFARPLKHTNSFCIYHVKLRCFFDYNLRNHSDVKNMLHVLMKQGLVSI